MLRGRRGCWVAEDPQWRVGRPGLQGYQMLRASEGLLTGLDFVQKGNVGTLKDFQQEGTLCLDLYFRKITLVTVWKMG